MLEGSTRCARCSRESTGRGGTTRGRATVAWVGPERTPGTEADGREPKHPALPPLRRWQCSPARASEVVRRLASPPRLPNAARPTAELAGVEAVGIHPRWKRLFKTSEVEPIYCSAVPHGRASSLAPRVRDALGWGDCRHHCRWWSTRRARRRDQGTLGSSPGISA
jgi:hypothetical protein